MELHCKRYSCRIVFSSLEIFKYYICHGSGKKLVVDKKTYNIFLHTYVFSLNYFFNSTHHGIKGVTFISTKRNSKTLPNLVFVMTKGTLRYRYTKMEKPTILGRITIRFYSFI